MDNLMNLALEAHSDEHNHHRRYEMVVGKDLLDDWTLSIRYGRVGHGGQEIRFASRDAGELQRIIRDRLKRRLSAPKRIGCSYQLVAFQSVADIQPHAWLPSDVMALLLSSP